MLMLTRTVRQRYVSRLAPWLKQKTPVIPTRLRDDPYSLTLSPDPRVRLPVSVVVPHHRRVSQTRKPRRYEQRLPRPEPVIQTRFHYRVCRALSPARRHHVPYVRLAVSIEVPHDRLQPRSSPTHKQRACRAVSRSRLQHSPQSISIESQVCFPVSVEVR